MISALKWIPKGVAKETPDRFALSDSDYAQIASKVGLSLQAAREAPMVCDGNVPSAMPSATESDANPSVGETTKRSVQEGARLQKDLDESLIPGLQEYNLQDYDEDEKEIVGEDGQVIPHETGESLASRPKAEKKETFASRPKAEKNSSSFLDARPIL